ncbi:SapC family protein [Cognatishimia sp. MH4019]|uniref:SapC family protein n=1 Tax=Cognatishimia sp. MH4019 TaxID=2854030 RepID=UPI001CD398D0|nr:SapC family protein [Cognatishimia sp. MH4019]
MTEADSSDALPMFYKSPEGLSKDTHADLALNPSNDYSFAAEANAIPLMAAEMPQAMRSYPIVFAGAGNMPLALTGLKSGENVFIGEDGRWAEGHYIPAYVRRYPFVLAGNEGDERLTLCIDTEATSVTTTQTEGANPLFAEDEPTELTRNAITFCEEYQTMFNTTKAMVALINEHDLMTEQTSKITLPGGETHNISGFMGIDEAKLNDMPDEGFLALRKAGALGAIYCQLGSTNSWQSLLTHRG